MKTVENVRRTCADSERDPILKQMSEEGYSLVAVTDDGWSDGRVRFHYWSLYFTLAAAREHDESAAASDREKALVAILLQCYAAITGKEEIEESVDFDSLPNLIRARGHAASPILSDDRVREAAEALVNMRKTNPAAFPKRICPYMDQLERALAGEGEQASPVNMRQIEHEEYQVMRERDEFEDRLTVLAESVGHHFDVSVGEWSNCNEPDKIALAILNGEYKTKFDKASPADAEAFAQAEREFSAGETVPEASVPEAQGVVERVCEAYGRVALAAAREHDRVYTWEQIEKAIIHLYCYAVGNHSSASEFAANIRKRLSPKQERVTAELDACPFCEHKATMNGPADGWTVSCSNTVCGCTTARWSKQEQAAAAWNRRA